MPAPLLTVEDHGQLHALLRTIIEAKFHPQPQDPLIWRSPLVAAVALRVFEASVSAYEQLGQHNNAASSRKWQRSLLSSAMLPVVKSRLREDAAKDFWRNYSVQDKYAYVAQCISPFVVDEDVLAQLAHEAEA